MLVKLIFELSLYPFFLALVSEFLFWEFLVHFLNFLFFPTYLLFLCIDTRFERVDALLQWAHQYFLVVYLSQVLGSLPPVLFLQLGI